MLDLVNAVRATGADCPSGPQPAVPPLSMHPALRQAAREHSLDMGTQRYFDHVAPDGRDPFERMRDANYPGFAAGENIAAGNQSAQATFEQWMSSDGHCLNIMRDSFDEIGVGYAFVEGSPFGHYWTQTFGQAR